MVVSVVVIHHFCQRGDQYTILQRHLYHLYLGFRRAVLILNTECSSCWLSLEKSRNQQQIFAITSQNLFERIGISRSDYRFHLSELTIAVVSMRIVNSLPARTVLSVLEEPSGLLLCSFLCQENEFSFLLMRRSDAYPSPDGVGTSTVRTCCRHWIDAARNRLSYSCVDLTDSWPWRLQQSQVGQKVDKSRHSKTIWRSTWILHEFLGQFILGKRFGWLEPWICASIYNHECTVSLCFV